MSTAADLTPFGFTATESLVYGALLRLGPSTGYGVAHATRVARANTYHALEGLVGRAAAVRVAGRPARYRAADPRALLAQLAAEQGDALDRLSRALREAGEPAEPDTRSVAGARALGNVILQLVARAERSVEGVLAAELVRPTLPAWRRARERTTLTLRVAGEVPAEAQALGVTSAPAEAPTLLLIDAAHVVLATGTGEAATGIWSSHPALVVAVRLALGAAGAGPAP
jgi:sugar-specific transcriptional regulator TrmB